MYPTSDRVRVDVGGAIVEITWHERDTLLDKLRDVAEGDTIVERFWAAAASSPVEFNSEQRSRLRVTLEHWGIRVLPDGLADLLIALVRPDSGGQGGH